MSSAMRRASAARRPAPAADSSCAAAARQRVASQTRNSIRELRRVAPRRALEPARRRRSGASRADTRARRRARRSSRGPRKAVGIDRRGRRSRTRAPRAIVLAKRRRRRSRARPARSAAARSRNAVLPPADRSRPTGGSLGFLRARRRRRRATRAAARSRAREPRAHQRASSATNTKLQSPGLGRRRQRARLLDRAHDALVVPGVAGALGRCGARPEHVAAARPARPRCCVSQRLAAKARRHDPVLAHVDARRARARRANSGDTGVPDAGRRADPRAALRRGARGRSRAGASSPRLGAQLREHVVVAPLLRRGGFGGLGGFGGGSACFGGSASARARLRLRLLGSALGSSAAPSPWAARPASARLGGGGGSGWRRRAAPARRARRGAAGAGIATSSTAITPLRHHDLASPARSRGRTPAPRAPAPTPRGVARNSGAARGAIQRRSRAGSCPRFVRAPPHFSGSVTMPSLVAPASRAAASAFATMP